MNKNEILDRQLGTLEDLNVAELKARFLELYGFECGATNAKGLRNRLAYKLQEIYLGGLPEEDRNLLEKLADDDPAANLDFKEATPRPPAKGARLRREWKGKTYEARSAMTAVLNTTERFIVPFHPLPKPLPERTGTGNGFSG